MCAHNSRWCEIRFFLLKLSVTVSLPSVHRMIAVRMTKYQQIRKEETNKNTQRLPWTNLSNEIFQVVPLKRASNRMRCILCKRAQSPCSCFIVKFIEIIIIIPTDFTKFRAFLCMRIKEETTTTKMKWKKQNEITTDECERKVNKMNAKNWVFLFSQHIFYTTLSKLSNGIGFMGDTKNWFPRRAW